MWIKNCCCCCCCWGRAENLLILQCCGAMRFYWKNSRTEEIINHGNYIHFSSWLLGVFRILLIKNHKQDLAVRIGYLQCFHLQPHPTKGQAQSWLNTLVLLEASSNFLLSPLLFHFLPCCTDVRHCLEQSFLPAATCGRKFATVRLLPQAVHVCSLLVRRELIQRALH